MMQGYNKEEAIEFIEKRIHPQDHPDLKDLLPYIIWIIIDADMAYMHQN